MKRGWYKNRTSNEVLFCEGRGHCDKAVVVRNRDGSRTWMWKSNLAELYEPIKASGFPSLKPKDFKPRYAVFHLWSEGEAFVMEFEPGKFKVVMKDGREILRDEGTCKHFAKFFNDGSCPLVSEAEALARLDKPKPPVPAAEQFGPGPWYGGGLTYRQASFQEGYGFYAFSNKTKEFVGWVSYEVVRHLWDLNMVSKERPRNTESIDCQASAILDVPKKAFTPKWQMVGSGPCVIEWAVPVPGQPGRRLELWPKGAVPASGVKTGRTVEVQE